MAASPEPLRTCLNTPAKTTLRKTRGGDLVTGFRARLAVGTALASMAVVGYGGRGAYAGNCVLNVGTYECSGPANDGVDVTQTFANGGPINVTADGTFGINTSTNGGMALEIFGYGGASFNDNGNASPITGALSGINAANYLSGDLTITSTGHVTGNVFSGIAAFNAGGTNDLTIEAADTTGGVFGIDAYNAGDGDLSITSSGQATGTNGAGINAVNGPSGTSLTIMSNNATGYDNGINAINRGEGALEVTSTGLAAATYYSGIRAYNSAAGTHLTIHSNNASGEYGINALNRGMGTLSITSTGTASGDNYGGIFALNTGNGIDLIIQAQDTTGDQYGILAQNQGIGELSIDSSGTASSFDGRGIWAQNFSGATNLTIQANNASGHLDGIRAENFGSGPTTITVTGTVTGNVGTGIATYTGAGGNTEINLNAGADVSATSGVAITNDDGDSTTTVNAGASVTGAIRLGNGSDNLTFDGGDFSGVTEFNGGDDTSTVDGFVDTLAFRNVAGTVAGANLLNWENVEIGANGALQFSDDALSTMNLNVIDDGTLEQRNGEEDAFALTGDLSVANGGALAFDIFSDTSFDSFSASGMAEFGAGAELDFLFDPLFMPPGGGTELTFFTAAGGITGFGNLSFNFAGLDPLYDAFVNFDDQLNTLSLSFQMKAADVPVPPSVTLLLPGLIGLLGIHGLQRRRSRTRRAAQQTGTI